MLSEQYNQFIEFRAGIQFTGRKMATNQFLYADNVFIDLLMIFKLKIEYMF